MIKLYRNLHASIQKMVKSALIVVDMQNDFLTGTLALRDCPAKQNGVDVVPVINSVIDKKKWDLIVYTLDWHPAEHISFATNSHKFLKHKDSRIDTATAEVMDQVVFEVDGGSRREQMLWPPHCVQTTWGAQLHKDLKVVKDGCQIYKGIHETVDSYSAFYDNDKINETRLREILREHGIERTYVCGVATDVCVSFTAVDSQEIGFETFVITDACAGVSIDNIRASTEKWAEVGVKCITSDQIEPENAVSSDYVVPPPQHPVDVA